ncbi:Calcium-transporting ATPase 8 family protein [Hibiscus syriacus]|uniref:Calcium-transporting ATPase 8 family protein n=1 Tax=Hibiscus syriacus TaxID=106335 RepID=A0A6A2XF37_HIBSY|nr:Calcium-transporting ATPase 8 family protein [Hibiscus syriacus]
MPALVNHGGDDFCSGTSLYTNSTDLGRLCSISSRVDAYCPPRKRSRISASFSFGESEIEKNKKPSIDVLPDEYILEIFKRLPGGRERSSCACVSKYWLTLLTGIRKGEYVSSKEVKENVGSVSDDGFTRCLKGKKASDLRLAALAVGTSCRARGCPSLKSVSLWNVHRVGDEGLSQIAKECHLLEKLDLCLCPSVSDKGLIAIAESCPNFTTLSIECCPKIGNEGLQAIA